MVWTQLLSAGCILALAILPVITAKAIDKLEAAPDLREYGYEAPQPDYRAPGYRLHGWNFGSANVNFGSRPGYLRVAAYGAPEYGSPNYQLGLQSLGRDQGLGITSIAQLRGYGPSPYSRGGAYSEGGGYKQPPQAIFGLLNNAHVITDFLNFKSNNRDEDTKTSYVYNNRYRQNDPYDGGRYGGDGYRGDGGRYGGDGYRGDGGGIGFPGAARSAFARGGTYGGYDSDENPPLPMIGILENLRVIDNFLNFDSNNKKKKTNTEYVYNNVYDRRQDGYGGNGYGGSGSYDGGRIDGRFGG